MITSVVKMLELQNFDHMTHYGHAVKLALNKSMRASDNDINKMRPWLLQIQFLSAGIVRRAIVRGAIVIGGNCPGGNGPRWQLSGGANVQVAIVLFP